MDNKVVWRNVYWATVYNLHMSLRPRRDPPHAVQIHNQLAADPVYARAAAVATGMRFPGLSYAAATGVASVPDISEHNAVEARVAALETGQKDMDSRLTRMEQRLTTEISALKTEVEAKIDRVETSLTNVMTQKIKTIEGKILTFSDEFASIDARIDNVYATLQRMQKHDSAANEPKGFQENDSPFSATTMGRPRPGF